MVKKLVPSLLPVLPGTARIANRRRGSTASAARVQGHIGWVQLTVPYRYDEKEQCWLPVFQRLDQCPCGNGRRDVPEPVNVRHLSSEMTASSPLSRLEFMD